MASKPKTKEYLITGRIHIDVGVAVNANTLDEALEKAKQLKIGDFIEILGEHNDSQGPTIVTICENSFL